MTYTIDLSGLLLLESEVAALQAQQAAAPTTFTGAAPFSTTFKAGVAGAQANTGLSTGGAAPGAMTTAQLVQRIQALLLTLQQLPQ